MRKKLSANKSRPHVVHLIYDLLEEASASELKSYLASLLDFYEGGEPIFLDSDIKEIQRVKKDWAYKIFLR